MRRSQAGVQKCHKVARKRRKTRAATGQKVDQILVRGAVRNPIAGQRKKKERRHSLNG